MSFSCSVNRKRQEAAGEPSRGTKGVPPLSGLSFLLLHGADGLDSPQGSLPQQVPVKPGASLSPAVSSVAHCSNAGPTVGMALHALASWGFWFWL